MGRADPGQDNQVQDRAFFEGKSHPAQREDDHHQKHLNDAVSHRSPMMPIIKRKDIVSPQAADTGEKIPSSSPGTISSDNFLPKSHDSSLKSQPHTPEKLDRSTPPQGHENHPNRNPSPSDLKQPFYSSYSTPNLQEFKSSFGGSYPSPGVGFPKTPTSQDGDNPRGHLSLQRSFSLSDSFHDDNSNSSESSFLNPNTGQPNYTRDPNTGQITYQPNKEGIFFCHLCSFSGTTRSEFEDHMTCHFEHICPHCDYKSRTEGRLKRHIKDFHTEESPDGFGSKRNMGRPKIFRCKQCDFVATDKNDFWQHARSHIKEEKLLQCPRCEFVTEYKHHLEYHLRNHFGSKPFKCNKCNYSCVNKSMLNSHMKSHTNVYQYRCADCTYATKYCHSLKLHLRKYNHKPATVLNTDGSLPQGIDAESSGLSLLQKRGPPRGPRGPRKDKFDPFVGQFMMPHSLPGMAPTMSPGMMSPFWPLLNQVPNGLPPPHHPMIPTPLSAKLPSHLGQNKMMPSSPFGFRPLMPGNMGAPFKCSLCSFATDIQQDLLRHVMKVHASENSDLFSIFGISSEALLEEQNRKMNFLSQQQVTPLRELTTPEKSIPTSAALHIKTEQPTLESSKTSPHSWPHHSPPNNKPNPESRPTSHYSMPEMNYSSYLNGKASPKEADAPEGEDIIKQMMNKFGSGVPIEKSQSAPRLHLERPFRESPLDLTKSSRSPSDDLDDPTNDGGNLSSGENSNTAENVVNRKRSRKGKAFKLDTLCLKLQEKQTDNAEEEEESNSGMEDMEDELQIDEMNEYDNMETNEEGDDEEPKSKEPRLGEMESMTDLQRFEQMRKLATAASPTDQHERSSSAPLNEPTFANESKDRMDASEEQIDPKEFIEEMSNLSENVPQAVRRGTELAWKIIQDTTGAPVPPPITTGTSNGHYRSEDNKQFPVSQDMHLFTTSTPRDKNGHKSAKYECPYCEIAFRDCVMYTMHMGYHGYKNPFKCNMCGYHGHDKVEFFLHIAREAHN
ncbi:protein hunchback-like [Saccostrea echinata]|uniref:protein hunchback-like n=1 Tax=Saccostrea echinata TaxID=191078 RepID=UPI002A7F7449|nr:protein hunchback-like [Saccostrea echinata]